MRPFTIDVPAERVDDLRARLSRTRLPRSEPRGEPWTYGTPLPLLRELVDYWRDGYDWRAVEARLNRLPQYLATVDGYELHVIVERGSGPAPLPLVLTHGWPGSFVEFESVIEPLAHPERFGGAAEDAFDVVVPTLPGYGWSSPPPEPITTRDVARLWDALLTGELGLGRYVAQGGDWGSMVTSWLGVDAGERVAAIHVNMMGLRPYLGEGSAPLTAEEERWQAQARERLRWETGYQAIQGTKPQTLAYALTDSPAGLLAWIVEKFHGWSEPAGDRPPFSFDQLLTNVMIYWVTESFNSSTWLYTAARRRPDGMRLGRDEFVHVPTALLTAPFDLFPPPPPSWVARVYNCVRRVDLRAGGHFLAYERPADFVADVREAFRPYR